MQLTTPAIIVAVLPHGEHGAIVRLSTPDDGIQAGYVRGGRSRRLRPVLGVGNVVVAELRARVDSQLAALTVELVQSRAALGATAPGAAALEWTTALVAQTLPEGQAHHTVHTALGALLDAIERAPPAQWLADLARFELSLLSELGFGLDLSHCAATGMTTNLAFVSPRSSTAVSRAAGAPYATRLLALPPLLTGGEAAPGDLAAALATTGFFVARDLLEGAARRILPARDRLVALVARLDTG